MGQTSGKPSNNDEENGGPQNSESASDKDSDKAKYGFETETSQEASPRKSTITSRLYGIVKVLTTLFFLGCVLLGGIVTKSTFLVLENAYTQSYAGSTCPRYETEYYYNRYMIMLILMTCLCFPEAVALGRCIIKTALKTSEANMNMLVVMLTTIPETAHAIGSTFLVFKVFPNIDANFVILMLPLVVLVPAVIDVFRKSKQFWASVVSVILLLAGYGLLGWQLFQRYGASICATAIIALLAMSARYWENFIPISMEEGWIKTTQSTLNDRRFTVSAIHSIARIIFIVGFSFLIHFVIDGNKFVVAERRGNPVRFIEYGSVNERCSRIITSLWYTGLTNCLCSFATFYFGAVACQTRVQRLAYHLPLVLTTPVMIALTSAYTIHGIPFKKTLMEYFNLEASSAIVDEYIGWRINLPYDWTTIVIVAVGSICGCLGIVLVTLYLHRKNVKLKEMEHMTDLFVKLLYGGNLISEELMLNRRQYRYKSKKSSQEHKKERKGTPYVFLCVTMWHEEKEEMKQLLTSIMRLDHKFPKTQEKEKNPFRFEVHIFLDDAIAMPYKNFFTPNQYARQLLELLPEAAKRVKTGSDTRIGDYVRIDTTYGGRVECTLPNDNKFNIHLKDKRKIRKGKRWSQCMYMHYILKYLHKTEKKNGKEISLSNTYILALDGDVDFRPKALDYLLKRMDIDENVGAACGRIHPIGSGPVVWFQKFEYAVGHWLQKTAEDVLGCVLCSPGCFSLFSGEALAETNVAGTYEKSSTEARHKIQWDQGEDRWLCTLLLKQGKKIEYCAASDSSTFAPDDFAAFFKQRRRWAPSTVANVLDILYDFKAVVKNNDNINRFYILYQAGLMIASTIAPATVVLVIQAAFQYVFGMSAVGALLLSLIPIVIYVVICYAANESIQLTVARVLTLAYGLVMMAVLVGVIGQMVESLLNPSSLFLLAMIVIFVSTGLLHPHEWTCLLHGVTYYICVPSAFIFLPIYSYCNMNIVKWGTRENKASSANKTQQEKTEKKHSVIWNNFCRCFVYNHELVPESEQEAPPKNVLDSEAAKKRWSKARAAIQVTQAFQMGNKNVVTPDSQEKKVVISEWHDAKPFSSMKEKDIAKEEADFWKWVIENHLKPKDITEEDREIMEESLKTLRNKATGAYFFINGLWIVLTFMLTLVIHDVNITMTDRNGNVILFNPLAFLFLIFYVTILLIQYLAMLVHRWSTFLDIMAERTIKLQSKKTKKDQGEPNQTDDATAENNGDRLKTESETDNERKKEQKRQGLQKNAPNEADDRPSTSGSKSTTGKKQDAPKKEPPKPVKSKETSERKQGNDGIELSPIQKNKKLKKPTNPPTRQDQSDPSRENKKGNGEAENPAFDAEKESVSKSLKKNKVGRSDKL